MTLQDVARQQTQDIRDSLIQIDRRRAVLMSERSSAEDRRKRASTEVTRQQAIEEERKRLVAKMDNEVQELQQQLDEIDRQRTELIGRFLEKQDEKGGAEHHSKEARQATERARLIVHEAKAANDKADKELKEIQSEKSRYESRLREAYVRSLDIYLSELSERIEQTLAGQEERQRRLEASEAFKTARHEDREIGDLCDQRDQFRQLIEMASVPGVKVTLGMALQKIEEELQRRYPGALSIEDTVQELVLNEALHYYKDRGGKTSIILPISELDWTGIEKGEKGARTTTAMRLVWSMVKEGGLKKVDGEFHIQDGRCIFASNFSEDEMAALEGFSLSVPPSPALIFRFCPLPLEIEEALVYEATNS